MELFRFLKTLWPVPLPGWLTLTFIPAAHAIETSKPSLHIPLADLPQLDGSDLDVLRGMGEKLNKHTYFGLSARSEDLGEDSRGRKGDCIALPGFCMDFDIYDPRAHKAPTLPRSQDEVIDLLRSYPDPSLVVDSGFGLHVYWLLDKPWLFPAGAYAPVEAAIRQFVTPMLSAASERGWRLDACDTVDRVWRLPGFINCKVPEEPRLVQVVLDSGVRFPVTDLLGLSRPPSFSPAGGSSRPSEPTKTGGGGQGLLDKVRECCERLVRPDRRELLAKVLAGESFAEAGDRDRLLQLVCSVLAWIPPGRKADPAALVEILRPSLTVWANEPDAKLTIDAELKKAIDKIRRSQEDYESKQGKAIETLRAAFGRARVKEADSDEPPDEDEKAALLKLSIIQYRSSYYIYDFATGLYTTAKTKEELPVVLANKWVGDIPVTLTFITAKGDVRPKTEAQLLKEYGTNVDSVILDLTVQKSGLSPDRKTFYEAAAIRRVEPKYDAEVEEWLRVLAGAEVEKLLDWLACVPRLNEPICAVLIKGPPGTGKTLLATGVARLYTEMSPARLENVVGTSFNEELVHCPIIHADEGLPKGVKGLSEQLRSLIAGHLQTIKRKFLPPAYMKGSIRLMVTTNGDHGLSELGDENFSLEDLDAVAGRFLCIDAKIKGDYLQSRVAENPEYLRRWIEGDALPQHIMWLNQTRTVTRKGRFLVEGELADTHRQLVIEGHGVRGAVLEWLTRFLDNPRPVQEHYRGVESRVSVAENEVLVNTQAVVDCWELYMGEKRMKPTTTLIGRNLSVLSAGTARPSAGGRARYHRIRWDLVFDWAKTNQIGDLEVMKWILETGVVPKPEDRAKVPNLPRLVKDSQEEVVQP